ncbi:60S ribosomal protein L13a (Fragment) [Seminavis robusta]|uniref:60S ribosomal protein L13a n=1 Tax=Seminavis robusta TaxID=568900 RepID=A0A9N8E530_9STRA
MVCSGVKVIDGRDHLLGRLASIVAKELLAGQKIVIVRCDLMCVSGSLTRNRTKYAQFRRKAMNTNPRKGPFHYKSPARIVWRTIRGMVHQKTARGQDAINRLSTFEGIPAPYDKQKTVVVPAALRIMRLKSTREHTVIGELADSVGWKHKELLGRLEAKRKEDGKEYWAKKKEQAALKRKAEAACASELAKVNDVLAAAGY